VYTVLRILILGLHLFSGFVEVVVAAAVFPVLDWRVAAAVEFTGLLYHYQFTFIQSHALVAQYPTKAMDIM